MTLTDPRITPDSIKLCPRCGGIMTRETRSDFNDEVICTVCVEGEMEVKDERN